MMADRKQADRFQYELTLEDGERRHTITIDDERRRPRCSSSLNGSPTWPRRLNAHNWGEACALSLTCYSWFRIPISSSVF